MKISTKGRYALRVMIDLAQQDKEKFISIQEISARQEISAKYLEAIFSILTKAGYLISFRGNNGGYKLAREPKSYTIGSILKLTEGSLSPVACLDTEKNQCNRLKKCYSIKFWQKLDKLIDNYVESVTIEDLINNGIQGDDYII